MPDILDHFQTKQLVLLMSHMLECTVELRYVTTAVGLLPGLGEGCRRVASEGGRAPGGCRLSSEGEFLCQTDVGLTATGCHCILTL